MRKTTSIDKARRDKTAVAGAKVLPVYAQTGVAGASNGRAAAGKLDLKLREA